MAQNCNPNQLASKEKKEQRKSVENSWIQHGLRRGHTLLSFLQHSATSSTLTAGWGEADLFFELILKYSHGFCLDWQQHLNVQFCEEIDAKDNVIPVVSMAVDMLDGIYPSRVLCNHLVSQSSFQPL